MLNYLPNLHLSNANGITGQYSCSFMYIILLIFTTSLGSSDCSLHLKSSERLDNLSKVTWLIALEPGLKLDICLTPGPVWYCFPEASSLNKATDLAYYKKIIILLHLSFTVFTLFVSASFQGLSFWKVCFFIITS